MDEYLSAPVVYDKRQFLFGGTHPTKPIGPLSATNLHMATE